MASMSMSRSVWAMAVRLPSSGRSKTVFPIVRLIRPFPGPALVALREGQADGLRLEVLLEALHAVLPAEPALAVSAERRVGAEPLAAVDRDRSGAGETGHAPRP